MAPTDLPPLTFTFGPFRLDHETGQLHRGDHVVSLQPRALAVLRVLVEAGGNLVTKEDLIGNVWNGAFIEESNITKCVAEIRQALRVGFRGVDPITTVRKQGYRFAVPVSIPAPVPSRAAVVPVELNGPAAAMPSVVELQPPRRPGLRVSQAAAIVAAAGLIGGAILLFRPPKVLSKEVAATATAAAVGTGNPAVTPPPSLATTGARNPAVMPQPSVAMLGMRNLSPDRQEDWVGLVLSETLNDELLAGRTIRVARLPRVAQVVRDMELDGAAPWDAASIRAAAAELGVDTAITGTYVVSGKNIRLDLQLADAQTGATRNSVSETGTEDMIAELISESGSALRRALGQDGAAKPAHAPEPVSNNALRLYADGLVRLHEHDGRGARILLCRAEKLAPDFSPIRDSLARIHRPPGRAGEGPPGPDDPGAENACPPDDGGDLPPVHAGPRPPGPHPPPPPWR